MNQPTDHVTEEELLRRVNEAKEKVDVTKKYYHYKNPQDFYEIVDIGLDEATEEPRVIYRALYGNGFTWIRSVENFLSKVTNEDGEELSRFTVVE